MALALLLLSATATAPLASGAEAKRILSPHGFPGWQTHNVAFPAVFFDEPARRYRMFYAGSPAARLNGSTWEQWATLTATSGDGITWTLPDDYDPILLPHRFREGEVADPAALATRFDSVAAFGASPLRDASGYRVWYTGWSGGYQPVAPGLSREIGFAIGLATSRDGTSWTRHAGKERAGAVVAPGGPGDPDALGAGQPTVIHDGDMLRMWYECFDGTRWRICTATSADGQTWAKAGVALETGPAGTADEVGVRNPVVVKRGAAYELWYQGEGALAPRYRVLRATSADGRSWRRAGEVALHPGTPVADAERIHVDTVLPLPSGGARVYFAREVTTTRAAPYGDVVNRRHHIYTEIVP